MWLNENVLWLRHEELLFNWAVLFNEQSYRIRSHQHIEYHLLGRRKKTIIQEHLNHCLSHCTIPSSLSHSSFRIQCILFFELTMHCCLPVFFVFFCFVLSSCLFHLHDSKSVVTLIPQLVDVEWVSVFVFGWCSFCVRFTSFPNQYLWLCCLCFLLCFPSFDLPV